MSAPIKYGLSLPKKAEQPVRAPVARSSAVKSMFNGDDSDEDDEPAGRAQVNKALHAHAGQAHTNKKIQREMEAALAEDATVYQYDEVYDEMTEARQKADPRLNRLAGGGAPERKAKYIDSLMKAAADRKKVEDVRLAHKIQRERQQEEEEYGDKEEFITSAYRKKLEEVRKQEELDRLQEAVEARNDVTKKGDISGFYRNLLTKNVAFGASEKPSEPNAPAIAPAAAAKESAGDSGDRQSPLSGVRPAAAAPRSPSPPPASAAMALEQETVVAPADMPGGLDTRRFDARRRREQEERQQAEQERQRSHGHHGHDRHYEGRGGDGRPRDRARSPLHRGPPVATAAAPALTETEREEAAAKFARKATEDTISAARERYLARRKERAHVPKPTME